MKNVPKTARAIANHDPIATAPKTADNSRILTGPKPVTLNHAAKLTK